VPLNNLAWLLATATDANLRNGQEAVKRAELACTISGYRVIGFIGTLAAAYAEAGRFQDAIAAAEEACDLAKAAGEQELLHRNEQLLTLYRERRPFRERR
jgi:tetratricopeptide (TPR) repeat protein